MAKRLAVLQIISSAGLFGAEKVVLQLSEMFSQNGVRNVIGVFNNSHSPEIKLAHIAKKNNIDSAVFHCRGKLDLKLVKDIRGFVKKMGINIIHSHGYKSNFYNLLSVMNTGVKCVATCHNWVGETNKLKLYKILDKFILNKFNAVCAVSITVRDELKKAGVTESKLFLVRNGITLNKFKHHIDSLQRLKESLHIKEDDVVVGTVGRMTEEKGQVFLIRAFKNISVEIPSAKLLLVGDGDQRNMLQSEAKSIKLEDKVIFSGLRDDVAELLFLMDIFVLPSLLEAMPLALLEAMAAQKPIIASGVGEIPHIIKNEYSGLVINPGDIDALENSIVRLIKDKALAAAMGQRNFENVSSNYSAEKMAQEYTKVYESLLQ